MANISKAELRKEINAILKDADLSSTSAKKVRQMLEEKLDCNLAARKKEIDGLVMDYVNEHVKNEDSEEDGTEEEEASEEDEASEEEVKEKKSKRAAPAKKKATKKARQDDDDEEDEEENSESEANSDAMSEEEYSPKKTTKPKAKKGAKGRRKKGSDSDSDDDWNKSKKTKKAKGGKRATAYTRPYKLSAELSNLIGSKDPMPRHEVIKRVWAIIKERNLYDPENKQFAICDDELMKVMGVKRFRTFGMMKYLKNHFLD
ncbi:upstream activation factor subunit spp27 [Ctenocephalides felis]|uniref:upstream activation factor subunit spp27 n=1 Tax=Ctenocephalides felis TaxID=7515 RepID=UPI000E6E4C31|nr:upstream activation factor subunit spp27 [Ctenocephalides felis]